MANYDTILNITSIVLLLLILFIILFGCKNKRYREQFTDKNDKKEDDKPTLSAFENKVLEQLSNGELTTEAFTDLIKKEKFTQDNLNNVINYVEYSKGVV
jgi:uncharacterized membrane protein